MRAPGAGHFEFERLQAEWQGEAFTLTGRVNGHNLAYLYTEVLLKDTHQRPVLRPRYARVCEGRAQRGYQRHHAPCLG